MLVSRMDEPVEAPAFQQFYERAWHEAARWAAALTGDVAAGEEVAQEAFLAMAGRYSRLDNPAGYLRRSIVNGARMWQRSGSRRIARERGVATPTVAPPPTAVDGDLLDVLAKLPYDQRAAVVLRYWADWTDESIAAALGCRPSTVRSHLRRGLRRLRADLTPHDLTGEPTP
jgi:RNA polymerase sigma factor (sigma-70 family)